MKQPQINCKSETCRSKNRSKKGKKLQNKKEKIGKPTSFIENVHERLKMQGPRKKLCILPPRCTGNSQSIVKMMVKRKKWLRVASGRRKCRRFIGFGRKEWNFLCFGL